MNYNHKLFILIKYDYKSINKLIYKKIKYYHIEVNLFQIDLTRAVSCSH